MTTESWTQLKGSNEKKISLEEKLTAIGLVFQGESARSVSRKLHLGHHTLYEWIETNKHRGVEGLKSKQKGKKRLSYEDKNVKLFVNIRKVN